MGYIEILLILSILPVVLMGYIIYKNDKVEKESPGLLCKLFLGGIGAVAITLIITILVYLFFPVFASTESLDLIMLIPYCFIIVGLVEEGSKWIILKGLTWKNKEFNYIYDAIVYAVFVSLGFAALENIIYVLNGGIATAITRTIFSIPGHTFFGVFMGYYYGLAKQAEINGNIKLEKKNLYLSLLVPTTLHGIFDYCLFSMQPLLIIVYLIFVIFLYVKAFKRIKQLGNIKLNFLRQDVTKKYFCPNCGTEITSNYCYSCGHKKQI